jgi:undecaprenyl-diphosphatase
MSASGASASATGKMSRMQAFGSNIAAGLAALVRPPRKGPRIAWPPRGRLAIGAALAILAVAAAMLLIDAWSAGRVKKLPDALVAVFADVTDLGLSGWFLYPLGVALIAIALIDRPTAPSFVRSTLAAIAVRLGFVFTAIAVPGLFVALIKRLIGRARPFIGDVGEKTWVYVPFSWRADYASLPSGHATTAFAAAVAIGAIWPQARLVMWVYAFVIALSRVIVTVHHPSDVIAGAIVGTLGALLVRNWFAARRLGFAVGADGGVIRLPGPGFRRIKAVARRLTSA